MFPNFMKSTIDFDYNNQEELKVSKTYSFLDTKQYLEESSKTSENFESYSLNKRLMSDVIEILLILMNISPWVYLRKKE